MTFSSISLALITAAAYAVAVSATPEPLFGGVSPSGNGGSYSLEKSNRGRTFYSSGDWDFWSKADPTHGAVDYLTQSDAEQQGLIGITNDGTAFARASNADLATGVNRASVRFQTADAYDEAVVIFDVVQMPLGCATWPALWTVAGATWPHNGEIDVMEEIGYTASGTNANQYSVHIADDSPNTAQASSYSGKSTASQCRTDYAAGANGCSIRDRNNDGPSWGEAFNRAGGGVWALQFGGGNGVKIWFWSRGQQPTELRSGAAGAAVARNVSPDSWGKPSANFQSNTIDSKLKAQNVVMDITIGGDWAGSQPLDGQCKGQSVAQSLQKGSNYDDARFVFNGIDVYTPLGSGGLGFRGEEAANTSSAVRRHMLHKRRRRQVLS